MSALIEIDGVCKYYQMGDTTVNAADHISMRIDPGELVAIVGQSGSGNSTCMNIIGCLDVPTDGTYRLDGRDVGQMSRNELAWGSDGGECGAMGGQSGAGKTTCMNNLGCLDVPTDGTYRLDGRDVGQMSRNELAAIRNEKLGFIFQQYNLLPKLNLLENVEVPLIYAGVPRAERHALAKAALEQVCAIRR